MSPSPVQVRLIIVGVKETKTTKGDVGVSSFFLFYFFPPKEAKQKVWSSPFVALRDTFFLETFCRFHCLDDYYLTTNKQTKKYINK